MTLTSPSDKSSLLEQINVNDIKLMLIKFQCSATDVWTSFSLLFKQPLTQKKGEYSTLEASEEWFDKGTIVSISENWTETQINEDS